MDISVEKEKKRRIRIYTEADVQIDRTDKPTDGQTERKKERQTNRQTDRDGNVRETSKWRGVQTGAGHVAEGPAFEGRR